MGTSPQLTLQRGEADEALVSAPGRDLQHLWFSIGRHQWRSVVLVPCDPQFSPAVIVREVAEVGRRLLDVPASAIVPQPADYGAVAKMLASSRSDAGDGPRAHAPQFIVAIQSVLLEPLGLAVAQAAEAVVLCVEIGNTRVSSVRKTIAVIGRERISGCVIVA